MTAIRIFKIGGKVIDEEKQFESFLKDFAQLDGPKILVHGGGKMASELAEEMGVSFTMLEGRRVTDDNMLRIATMVYGGLVNKTIVAKLQALDVNSIGLTGADLNIITSNIRPKEPVDFGFVGDIASVNHDCLKALLVQGATPVIAPLTHDGNGQLLNTNADNMASFIASTFAVSSQVELNFCFEQQGVLNENSVLQSIDQTEYLKLKTDGTIRDGMIPKLDLAFKAKREGSAKVRIMSYKDILDDDAGTEVIL